MIVAAAVFVLAAALAGAAPAAAAPWSPPQPLTRGKWFDVRAAVDPRGTAVLEAIGSRTALFVAGPGAPPVRRAVPAALRRGFGDLAVGPSGDAVILTRDPGVTLGIRSVDGSVGALQKVPGWHYEDSALAAAMGPDGTAVVAWSPLVRGGIPAVEVSVRPPGGAFGPPARLAHGTADGESIGSPFVAVDATGGAEVLFVHGRFLVRATRPPGGAFATPTPVMPFEGSPFLTIGPDGRAVLGKLTAEGSRTSLRVWRRAAGAERFGPPQAIAGSAEAPTIALTPDGGAVVAYAARSGGSEDRVRAHRAVGDGAFGPAQTVSERAAHRGSLPSGQRRGIRNMRMTANARGDVMLAWMVGFAEALPDQLAAAIAPAGAPFKPPEYLGAVSERIGALAVTLSDHGEGRALWTDDMAFPTTTVRLATASGLPTAPSSPRDRRPPRAHLSVRRSALRTAVRTGRLRVRLRCDEPCSGTVGLLRFPRTTVTVRAPGSGTAELRLPGSLRRALARRLRRGPVTVDAAVTDRTGNVTQIQAGRTTP